MILLHGLRERSAPITLKDYWRGVTPGLGRGSADLPVVRNGDEPYEAILSFGREPPISPSWSTESSKSFRASVAIAGMSLGGNVLLKFSANVGETCRRNSQPLQPSRFRSILDAPANASTAAFPKSISGSFSNR